MTDQPPKTGQVIKRTGSEANIEASMRQWFEMREEHNHTLQLLADTQHALHTAEIEREIFKKRAEDLEAKYEALLAQHTTLKASISHIGAHADNLSLAISEVLALTKPRRGADNEPDSGSERHVESSPSPTTASSIDEALRNLQEVAGQGNTEAEDQAIADLARRLGPAPIDTSATKEAPPWLHSNSQSPRPSPSTPTTGLKTNETPSLKSWRK